jgi:NAD(P)-dependent dehydrogenase (short-subunit alcohol dehydrogenase family)/DNA-binding transcriptional ArsR family regulator
MELFDLKGQVAAVTGAARGIGAAAAAMLERFGAEVARLDVEAREGIVACDVADEASVERAFGEIAASTGRIDILVNNAGVAVRKTSFDLSAEEWDRVLAVNLRGVFLCSRVAAREMRKAGGGAIVNLASIMGFSGGLFPNPAYQASKGGVVNLTRAMALELAEHNIRVNAVAPTFVRTDLTVPVFSNPDVLAAVMRHTPLGRLPEPEDIAAAIVYLASPAARCVTGITLPVDSGYLALSRTPTPPGTGLDLYLTHVLNTAVDRLSATFAALADPTRRAILARLARGEATVGDLASPFEISLPAVSRHLKVLEQAGLIEREVDAQWRLCRLKGRRLREAHRWLDRYRRYWEESLDRLVEYLEKEERR